MINYNLTLTERHYMIEVMVTFKMKNGRVMTEEEMAKAIAKMRAK